MQNEILRGIVVVLLWVGMWGIIEMIIDNIAQEDNRIRLVTYILAVLIGILVLWILDVQV